jgi:hypothetical protein
LQALYESVFPDRNGRDGRYFLRALSPIREPDDGEDDHTLMRHADIAMYTAEQRGRNNYQHYTPDMNLKPLE